MILRLYQQSANSVLLEKARRSQVRAEDEPPLVFAGLANTFEPPTHVSAEALQAGNNAFLGVAPDSIRTMGELNST